VRILISSVGRRVELVQAFRRAGRRLRVPVKLYGTDVTMLAPAMHHVDEPVLVPPIRRREFLDALAAAVSRHQIDLLVPTIDTELPKLAAARSRLRDAGCTALVSARRVVKVCRDKLATHRLLVAHDIDVPQTWSRDELPAIRSMSFPCFLKERFGSAGKGAVRIDDAQSLRFHLARVRHPIVQEYLRGDEYTQDVYCGLDGRVRCVVSRQRLQVRSGEVQKARVVKDSRLVDVSHRVVEVLGDCVGVITVQCIVGPRGRVSVLEVNPRFGGGVPLSIHAGADFPRWLLAELLGRSVRVAQDCVCDGVHMLRYDQSVFWRPSSP
jgi:carbamoyl-phosphate synthase large subunit